MSVVFGVWFGKGHRKVYAYQIGAGRRVHGEIPFLCCEQTAFYA